MRKIIKESLIVLFTTLTIFLLVDFFLGDKILNIFNVKKDNSFRIPNNIFNHGFKKNYKTDNAFWGPHQYKFCTSEHGTRNDCSTNNMKKFDYAFIGDSQTEGVGLNFEDTYVGNFAKENKLNVINFGIVRSSPSLYYKRLKFFLNQEIKFKELFILIDISDLHDELKYNKNIFKNDKTNVCKSINSVNITNKFETISLLSDSMKIGNLTELTLSFGKTEILAEIIEPLNLNYNDGIVLNKIISSKSESDLSSWVKDRKVQKDLVNKLLTLIDCNGDLSIISKLKNIQTSDAHLSEIENIWDFIEKETCFSPHIDLTDFPGFNYHDGLVFSAHSDKYGFSIANGGEYFSQTMSGKQKSAIGFDQDIIAMIKLKD